MSWARPLTVTSLIRMLHPLAFTRTLGTHHDMGALTPLIDLVDVGSAP